MQIEQLIVSPVDPSKHIYKSLWISKNNDNDEIQCDVCLSEHDEEYDQILICDGCNAATHQTCYGGDVSKMGEKQLDQQDFYCDRCKYIYITDKQPSEVQCTICKDLQGVIVKTNIGWAHLTCINYIPEIWFTDKAKRNVKGQIELSRKGLYCHLCKHKTEDTYLIKCDFKDCTLQFHIRCGIKHELIQSWEKMNEQRINKKASNWNCLIFCHFHMADEYIAQSTQCYSEQGSKMKLTKQKIKKVLKISSPQKRLKAINKVSSKSKVIKKSTKAQSEKQSNKTLVKPNKLQPPKSHREMRLTSPKKASKLQDKVKESPSSKITPNTFQLTCNKFNRMLDAIDQEDKSSLKTKRSEKFKNIYYIKSLWDKIRLNHKKKSIKSNQQSNGELLELDTSQIKKLVQVYVQELQRCSNSQNSRTFTSSRLSDSLDLQIQYLKPQYLNKKKRTSKSKQKGQSVQNDQNMTFGGTQSQRGPSQSFNKKNEFPRVQVQQEYLNQQVDNHTTKNKSLSDLASDHQMNMNKNGFGLKNQTASKRSEIGSTYSSVQQIQKAAFLHHSMPFRENQFLRRQGGMYQQRMLQNQRHIQKKLIDNFLKSQFLQYEQQQQQQQLEMAQVQHMQKMPLQKMQNQNQKKQSKSVGKLVSNQKQNKYWENAPVKTHDFESEVSTTYNDMRGLDKISVIPTFASILGLDPNSVVSRKDLQLSFIQFAIHKQLVSSQNQMYRVLQSTNDPDVEWIFYYLRRIVRQTKQAELKIGQDPNCLGSKSKMIEFNPNKLFNVLQLFIEK